ncbi:hypothetical protein RHMOL_Rhmol07G0279600 [Rhododendron molle]|uniref:Uncharacterized protein n=1 Tax=Rhododendron molle TaxID=49168 RepID=A0ACC0N5T1_RHOML|nr:hypothetical protein RHMOL_Rhmol07G0279600 [Rhododendron molle]
MKNSSSERNTKMRNNDSDDDKPLPNRPRQEKAEDMKLWGILIFGLIGATATTFAVGHLRRSVDWFYFQVVIVAISLSLILCGVNVVLTSCLNLACITDYACCSSATVDQVTVIMKRWNVLVVLSGQVFRRKYGKDIIVECRSLKKRWKEW